MILPESPVFYFAKGKETESKNEILKFAKRNGKEMEDFKLKVDQQIDTDPENKDKSKTPKQCEGTLLELF